MDDSKDDSKEEKLSNEVKLKQKKHPNTNITAFISRKTAQKKESIISKSGKDRRYKVSHTVFYLQNNKRIKQNRYIVQLTMKFKGKYYVGTGTIVHRDGDYLYILTCGHNVRDFKPVSQEIVEASSVWFKLDNQQISAESFVAHPKYTAEHQTAFDLAVIKFKTNLAKRYDTFPLLLSCQFDVIKYEKRIAYIHGYPGEKHGEFMGMKGDIIIKHIQKTGLMSYENIDTTGGQSGSPITAYIAQTKLVYILGIHTTGDALNFINYGCGLTGDKIKWILSNLPNYNIYTPYKYGVTDVKFIDNKKLVWTKLKKKGWELGVLMTGKYDSFGDPSEEGTFMDSSGKIYNILQWFTCPDPFYNKDYDIMEKDIDKCIAMLEKKYKAKK